MRITVIGTGYVGLVSGVCFAELGHDVVCVDVDQHKVEKIRSGVPPIHEDGLAPMLQRHIGGRLRATTDLVEAVTSSDLSFIAVGTPLRDGRIDLSFVKTAAEQIGIALRDTPHYHVVVVKSTVVPGTTEDVVLPMLEAASGKVAGSDFGVGMNPEFLTEGEAVSDFLHPDRIVLGGLDDRSIDTMAAMYEPFDGVPIIRTNPRSAEMIKYASNTLLATMISFSNELANLSSELGGIDIPTVMKGVHLSRYLTDGEGRTAPLATFLYPGCGYGGSCLPKDTKALVAQGSELGVEMRVLAAVDHVNEGQPDQMLAILRRHYPSLVGLRVGVLGLAFRPGTDDMRESPAIPIIRTLLGGGAEVRAYDPVAAESATAAFAGLNVKLCQELTEAIEDVDAVLLVTRWAEFDSIPRLISHKAEPPLLIDGRRMIEPRSVPKYDGIGV
ncbi:UDP-glucose dehydrogenase family protein [Mycobacterium sp. NPDC051804]|uniref:UDP-glucose dehydrogenase family protein n=1 Tax=Mycobacterium sp. NPDC051804 TaxID=3364295 RepID=UPI0037AEE20B